MCYYLSCPFVTLPAHFFCPTAPVPTVRHLAVLDRGYAGFGATGSVVRSLPRAGLSIPPPALLVGPEDKG